LALSPLPEDSDKAEDTIKRNLKLQARLVNDLNETATKSSGGISIHTESLDLAPLVEDSAKTWGLIARNKGIELNRSVDPGAYRVQADAERMTQVLNNLLENACTFTQEGGHIDLRMHTEGEFVLIQVSDDGVGLDADELRMLFTPFWRGKRESRGKGLGRGLTIAEHLMRRHHGTLTASSNGLTKGSMFTARLPRLMDSDIPAQTQPAGDE
jgi:signal transduction histidine kinase